MRHVGIIRVSDDLLAKLLGLPDGMKIHRIWQDPRLFSSGSFEVMVIDHPDLPLVPEGGVAMVVELKFESGTYAGLAGW